MKIPNNDIFNRICFSFHNDVELNTMFIMSNFWNFLQILIFFNIVIKKKLHTNVIINFIEFYTHKKYKTTFLDLFLFTVLV